MRGLKIVLWITGVLCFLSVVGVFLPVSTWSSITEFFGAEVIPESPMIEYMIRLMSATYVGVGIYFIILALDPLKYGVLVPFAGVASLLLGIICAVTGMIVKMPLMWFLGDAIPCIVLGILILVLWQQAKKAVQASNQN